MIICPRCGLPLDDTDHFCRRCGLAVAKPANAAPLTAYPGYPAYRQPVPAGYPVAVSRKKSGIPYLIWGILLFFVFNPVGTPLAVAGTFFAAMANERGAEHTDGQILKARIYCIVASAVDFVTIAVCAVLLVQKMLYR